MIFRSWCILLCIRLFFVHAMTNPRTEKPAPRETTHPASRASCSSTTHLPSVLPERFTPSCSEQNDAYTYYSLVRDSIEQRKPLLVGKGGATEMKTLLSVDSARNPDGSIRKGFRIIPQLYYQSGVYPVNESFVVTFSNIYQEALNQLDLIVEWSSEHGQGKFFKRIPTHISSLTAQWSWYWKTPYTQHFAGKTVLVISPFHQYIEKQYHDHRHCIFPHDFNGEVLPDFTLKTLSVPLPMWNISIEAAAQPETFRGRTWLTALDEMKSEIRGTDFDIAVIGAGAFGLPLGAEVKRLGKVGIVLGGNVGPLFGIKGHRFDSRKQYSEFYYNECWVRMEKPTGADKMEKAAYW